MFAYEYAGHHMQQLRREASEYRRARKAQLGRRETRGTQELSASRRDQRARWVRAA
ncbi:hypothetical protein [Streptomyces sp. NPDC005438]|uniref:hypothetical protein n=1 Tax=Streptomyces sp. NPDC005438 TaxID=3156880 RepID=UPI0033A29161